jgi:mannan endo-1,4-beta-mannosidase
MQSPGVYDDNLFEGLDFLLSEMAKRDMKAVVVLSNYWTWSGGFAQYLKWAGYGDIPYPQDCYIRVKRIQVMKTGLNM